MKAITLTQPWASLVAVGAKRIETRSWPTKYRGPIAIHAAKGFPADAKRFCEANIVCDAVGWPRMGAVTQESLDESARLIKTLPRGMVVATATLVDCLPVELIELYSSKATHWAAFGAVEAVLNPGAIWKGRLSEQERAFGNYAPRRYGFLLDNITAIEPVPAKGTLSLWEWSGL